MRDLQHSQLQQNKPKPGVHELDTDNNAIGTPNVAEMLLHGLDDNEILDVWLKSICCQEFVCNFIDSGYNVSTLSRLTPQDLTAIGVTDPSKRQKLLAEIKKLNLQDGIPNFKPTGLLHLMSLIKLDKLYYKSLCDQNVDTLEKLCQLTWEDFEELGIYKLGHQKRLQLAIERLKNLEKESSKQLSKSVAEPIYDTNPSQILLMASTENHSNNGPIVNKQQQCASERSSTGSGSLQSINSSLGYQQTNYNTLQKNLSDTKSLSSVYNLPQQQYITQPMQPVHNQPHASKPVQQPIYDHVRLASNIQSMIPPSSLPQPPNQNLSQTRVTPLHVSQNSMTDITTLRVTPNMNTNYITTEQNEHYLPNHAPVLNQQSRFKMPLNALANLPKHQQQLLQQSSLYATLTRCPVRSRQPPPVPMRKDSLKNTSLTDYLEKRKNSLSLTKGSSMNGQAPIIKRNTESQVKLTKHKSFSGNAHMEALRARYLQNSIVMNAGIHQGPQSIESKNNPLAKGDSVHGLPMRSTNYFEQPEVPHHFDCTSLKELNQVCKPTSQYLHSASASSVTTLTSDMVNNKAAANSYLNQARLCQSISNSNNSIALTSASTLTLTSNPTAKPDYDVVSTTSLKQSNSSDNNSSYVSGSSQTLYNSASSGSNDHNLDELNSSPAKEYRQDRSNTQQQTSAHEIQTKSRANPKGLFGSLVTEYDCNATSGHDDNFPPPPSPLSSSELDDETSSFNVDKSFTDMNRGLVAFRIGS